MNKTTQKVMFSSKKDSWATPQSFFDKLNKIYGFTLDPCAAATNNKCARFYTEKQDGLAQSWQGESVFMNPPYGREIKHWIKKAHDESLKGGLIVCLIPARTDTAYWHDYCMKGTIRFIRGRLKFSEKNSAPFPSAIVIFGDKK